MKMKNFFFEVEYTNGKIKKVWEDDIAIALTKQREWAKKAIKNTNIEVVSAVMPS